MLVSEDNRRFTYMMSDSYYVPLSLPNIVESVFGIPFTAADLSRYSPSPEQVHELAIAVKDFYTNFPWKQKKDSELRPYISPQYVAGANLGSRYVSGSGGTGGRFVHDPSVEGEITRNVKKYLLYCHSLCIHDRLPYLLDYFEADPNSVYARARMPAVRALLMEYARLGELLRTGILVPISDEVFGGFILSNNTSPVYTSSLTKLFPEIPEDGLRLIEESIHLQEIQAERVKHQIDHFFPTEEFVRVLRALLAATQQKFTSSQLTEPFRVAMLEGIPLINPDAISEEDIIRMRKEDELFEDWRSKLARILERVHDQRHPNLDLEREVVETARDEIRTWKNSLEEKARKSSILRSLQDATVKATIGFAAGAAIGKDFESGLAGAGVTGALWLIWGAVQGAKDSSRLALARRHFLALGIEESEEAKPRI